MCLAKCNDFTVIQFAGQIEVLPHIVDEVQGRCPVFVDGGFSQGTDIFKALALGADLVSLSETSFSSTIHIELVLLLLLL